MTVDPVVVLGLVAGCCSTFALAPQAIRVWKTREVDQLSFGMLALMQTGSVLWLSYGILQVDVSIIWANAVAFCFIIYMLTMKIRDDRRRARTSTSSTNNNASS